MGAAGAGGAADLATWELEGEGGEGTTGRSEDEPYNPDFEVVERVIGMQPREDLPPLYLVKWRSLPYVQATWESCRTLLTDQSAIRRFWAFEQPPTAAEKKMALSRSRPPKGNFKKLTVSPHYKAGHTLRPYQLEGLNWSADFEGSNYAPS